MKQKLPEKKNLRKNLYLNEIRKTKSLSTSWTKCSLIRLLISKFSASKSGMNFFAFRMGNLSSRQNSKNGKIFLLNTLMLVALPISISIYRSTGKNIINCTKVYLTKIQKQVDCERKYIDIYIKSSKNLNKKFYIFPENLLNINSIFSKKIELQGNPSFFKSQKDNSISILKVFNNFFKFCVSLKKKENQESFQFKKTILQNLRNWGESDEIIVKSFFLLKKKRNWYFSNYIKIQICEIIISHFFHFEEANQKILVNTIYSDFYDKFNNSKLFIILENILFDFIYQFSKELSYEAKKCRNNKKISSVHPFIKKWHNNTNNNNNLIDYNFTSNTGEIKKDYGFFNFIHLDQPQNYNTSKYVLGWMEKKMFMDNRRLIKPIFVQSIYLNHSFLSLKKNSSFLFYLLRKISTKNNNKFILNQIFSLQKITKIKFLRKKRKSDHVQFLSWIIQKYHSKFILNYFFPFNFAYNFIRQNNSMNNTYLYTFQKEGRKLFFKISVLLPISSKIKEFLLFVNCMKLEEYSIEKKNDLDRLIDSFNKIDDIHFDHKLLLLILKQYKKNSYDQDFWIKNYIFKENIIRTNFYTFDNLIQNNYYKYFNKLLNKPYLKKKQTHESKTIVIRKYGIHKYSISLEEFVKKDLFYYLTDIEYKKLLTVQIFKSFDELKNLKNLNFYYHLFKKKIPHFFLTKVQLLNKLDIFFSKLALDKICNSLQILFNIRNIEVNQDELFSKFEKYFNQDLIKHFKFSDKYFNNSTPYFPNLEMSKEYYVNFLIQSFLINKLPSDLTKIDKLFSISNSNEQFLFFLNEINNKTNNKNKNTIKTVSFNLYSQFLIYFSNYKKFETINVGIKPFFYFQEQLIQLTNILFSKIFYKNIEKIELYEKFVNRNNFYFSMNSKRTSLREETNKVRNILYHKSFVKNSFISSCSKKIVRNILIPQLNKTRIENYYNILQSELLLNEKNRTNKIELMKNFLHSKLKKNIKIKGFKYTTGNEVFLTTDKFGRCYTVQNVSLLEKFFSFKYLKYISWFFTFEWWKYNINIFIKKLQKFFLIVDYHLEYYLSYYKEVTQKNLKYCHKKGKNSYNSNLKWNSRFFILNYEDEKISKFIWSDFQLINNWNSFNWSVFYLVTFIYVFYLNGFSTLIALDSIDLWKHFETIKYLRDTSRAFYFTILMRHNKNTWPNKAENLAINFFSNLHYYIKNIRFYLVTKKKLKKWLKINKTLDLSRRKRNLLVQSLITPTRIKQYGFQSYSKQKLLTNDFDYRVNNQPGLTYFQYLVKIFKKKLVNYPFYLADKWIFFAFVQKIISSQTLRCDKRFDSRFQKIPIPLQFGLSCSKGILLIGPIETGRSYLIKNLAADSSVPLLGISINKLLYNKPDIITESWMNILIESLRRLNLILDLAEGMSPCIIWIRNIHQLNVNRSTQNIESDPTFLLGILLKRFQIHPTKTQTQNKIIVIASTHLPKKVDPSLISADRLDRIINIRLFKTCQRRNLFPTLLNIKNLQFKKNMFHINDFKIRTMGYNMRDLTALTNEISLINLTSNNLFVYTKTIQLALHRQVFGFTHTNNKIKFHKSLKILLYKVGRTIVQNILLGQGSDKNSLNINNYLWKKKFYYLSKWYYEFSINNSIVKESTILIHIFGCLAGIAARDSWFSSKKTYKISFPLQKSSGNDLDLAFGILENFSIDFPWLETCKFRFLNYRQRKSKMFLTTNFLKIMQDGIFAIVNRKMTYPNNRFQSESLIVSRHKVFDRRNCELKNTAWSPRFWRLSFSRSNFFDWIKRSNDFEFFYNFKFSKRNTLGKKNHYDKPIIKQKEQILYERILPRVRKRNIQELEYQFEKILLEEQFEILGVFCPSTQYWMEQQFLNESRFFIGKRILWDPTNSISQNNHFVFSHREFFVDEEMLRRLYVTYGVRRERERSFSNHRVKRFFLCRGYNKDLITQLSIRWWNHLPINQKQNIQTLKRIGKIGILLRRPHNFTPVYLYQRWLIENIPEKLSRLKLLTYRDRWIKKNNSVLNDSLTYMTLLESYQYLFEFFLSNKRLLNRMTKILLKKKWLFQNEIEEIINKSIKL